MSPKKKNGVLIHRMSIRCTDAERKIIDNVRSGFKLSSNAEAVRFVLNIWWKTLGSEAVDTKKLSAILVEECGCDDDA